MATSFFHRFRLRKPKSKPQPFPSTSKTKSNSDMEIMERRRFDSLESWSMILDSEIWTTGSRIYRGIYKQRAVAVKMVRIPNQNEETRALLEQQFKSEVALLSRLFHPNIVQFIAACQKPPVYCIITEYMSQGTLRMYLNKKEPYSLSTETILRKHGDLPVDGPEMIKEKPCTRKVDVYSFGIVLWELTTALLPFQGMTPVQAAFAVSEKRRVTVKVLRPIRVLFNIIRRNTINKCPTLVGKLPEMGRQTLTAESYISLGHFLSCCKENGATIDYIHRDSRVSAIDITGALPSQLVSSGHQGMGIASKKERDMQVLNMGHDSLLALSIMQNARPPLPASCQPALAHLIKRCWAANPSKRPDFSSIVSALEKYDECVKEGLPLTSHSGLVNRNAILERLKGCVAMSSSIPVHA
ncbi:Serine/threonine-protein kinase HT1 [Vitis vinifera]|uniref:Serine/threonine-protein kinase HT1 n=1 Tax=Vitis vinifera TaxID=29760 RepID=A0A438EDW2_VITVI|nr:Serine/threonine-protein kinase HT1 [Vitis vinifera]